MKYMLLIYEDEKYFEKMSEAEGREMMGEYGAFGKSIRESGNHETSAQLQATKNATTVRVRDGKQLVTDGPFAETREQLGGYYLIEAKDLDEAIGIAARIPSSRRGSIEVRPLVQMGAPTGA
ncbi:MAG: YciI family protein [Acidobacteriota bacterium]